MQQPAGQEACYTTTSHTKGARAEEREATAWREEKVAAPSDLPPDGTRRREENQCNNQPDKRRESGGTRGNGATRGAGRGRGGVRRGNATTSRTRGAREAE